MVYSDEPEEENCDISRYGTTISGEMIEETTSHDQKFGWKVEETPVQKEERSNRWEIVSPAQRKTPTTTTELSPMKDSIKKQGKACVSKVSTCPASLNAMTSRSVSYKEVATAPLGTVLKPLLGKVEVRKKTKIQMCSAAPETLKEEVKNQISMIEDVPGDDQPENAQESASQDENTVAEPEDIPFSSHQEKPIEKNGSKLSAAAEPFNQGGLSMTQPPNSVAVTCIYDVRASQGMLVKPAGPSAAARVP
ncbi:Tetratricopeptide repeat (TPR)-like superfamily protein [Melia azedarach]|uniref:Tetratricopeptide repeat (TPR)-like superfamily protein n=1 Tax=Melia azedarach TaxID=155640 RepID=A0ACC1Y7C1_MELAZ|nr:Tetratricopeptide repeat (TPR)-like superfamily protein [Melia azedarach]